MLMCVYLGIVYVITHIYTIYHRSITYISYLKKNRVKAYRFIPGFQPSLIDLDEIIGSSEYGGHYALSLGGMLKLNLGLFFQPYEQYNPMTDDLVTYVGERIPDFNHTINRNNISVLYDDDGDMTPWKLQMILRYIDERKRQYPRPE